MEILEAFSFKNQKLRIANEVTTIINDSVSKWYESYLMIPLVSVAMKYLTLQSNAPW